MTAPNPRRRDEILDAAEQRFTTQGYLATSVAELIADTQIAKGTFYHHFSSKEEVMQAVIDRRLQHLRTQIEDIAEQGEIPALERLLLILGGAQRPPEDAHLTAELERDGNELMQLRAMNATVQQLTEPLARILADGVRGGTMKIADPTATAASFLVVTTHLIDHDLMGWQRERDMPRLLGMIIAAEQLLGLTEGALAPLREFLS